jgi:hypothetical protein
MKRNIGITLLLLVVTSFGKEFIYFDSRVTFIVPDSWNLMKSDKSDTLVQHMYFIPLNASKNTRHSANAVINVRRIPDTASISWADAIVYSKNWPGYIVVNDEKDNNYWKTYLWRAQDGQVVYVGMHRIGVYKGILMEFLVSFPLLGKKDSRNMALMIDENYQTKEKINSILVGLGESSVIVKEFNMVSESMDIDSTSEFKTAIIFNEIPKKKVKYFRYKKGTNKKK